MGCANTKAHKIKNQLDQYESNGERLIIVDISQDLIRVDAQGNQIGDFFEDEIENEEYFYFENRFSNLMQKELRKVPTEVYDAQDKSEFISKIFLDKKLRKNLFKIIKRKGIKHAYRWEIWQLLQNFNQDCKLDEPLLQRRQIIYPKLSILKNTEVETIVNKDVLRTERHKFLFSEIGKVGSKKLYKICLAIGNFFPKIGYLQGMNFIAAFILQVSGLQEFETFNFLINFWKKQKNLYFGIFAERLPMLKFLLFAFHFLLNKIEPQIERIIRKMDIPDELWVSQWFICFFTKVLSKEFLLRIFDYLMITDCFGLVQCALAITQQLKPLFMTKDFSKIAMNIQKLEKLDFKKFVKKIKILEFSKQTKIEILNIYMKKLKETDYLDFHFYFKTLTMHFQNSGEESYNDFSILKYPDDYDSIPINVLDKQLQSDTQKSSPLNFNLNLHISSNKSIKNHITQVQFPK